MLILILIWAWFYLFQELLDNHLIRKAKETEDKILSSHGGDKEKAQHDPEYRAAVESRVFYQKMKGDYFRYLAEVTADSAQACKLGEKMINKEGKHFIPGHTHWFLPTSLSNFAHASYMLCSSYSLPLNLVKTGFFFLFFFSLLALPNI